jgi:hypothetical protein
MTNRKEQLEQAGPIRVEAGSDGSYGIGWKAAAWEGGNIVLSDSLRSEIEMRFTLGNCVIQETECKKVHVVVSCDGSLGTVIQTKPAVVFRDDQHSIQWTDYMIAHLNRYLPERLRTMALLTVREALAKSSEVHGIAETDWKQLAEAHGKIVEEKIKESLGVRSGPARLFETKQQYLNFLAEAARACRSAGKRFTQGWVADFATKKFGTDRVIDERMIRQWNKDFTVNWKHRTAQVNRRN